MTDKISANEHETQNMTEGVNFLNEEIRSFMSDMVSVEEQALIQMVSAPEMAGTHSLGENYRKHREETAYHARRLGERLEALGGDHSAVKEAVMKMGGKGFLLFARVQPDTPGKLHAHAYSYEAMEWAGYDILIRLAKRGNDPETMQLAGLIQKDERTMMDRLEAGFDEAFRASHPDADKEELQKKIPAYLADAHALNIQSIKFLQKGQKVAASTEISNIYKDQLVVSKGQANLIKHRLHQLNSSTSFFKDKALSAGAGNWKNFFQVQTDSPLKVAGFVYALKHLEIAGYELLRRTAEGANDDSTTLLCEKLLLEEQGLAGRLRESLPRCVDAMITQKKDGGD